MSIKSWELPEIEGGSGGLRTVPSSRPAVKPARMPTVEEIEAMQHQARSEAAREGFAEGLEQGVQEGREQGFAEGRRQGYEDGYAQGFAEGMDKGRVQGEEALAPHLRLLESLVTALEQPLAMLDASVREEIVALSMTLARMVIRREVHTQPEQIMDLVPQLLDLLPSASRQIRISLHPDDLGYLQGLAICQDASFRITWQEDDSIQRGGCRIQSEQSAIDATLEARTESVFSQLSEAQKTLDTHHGSS